MNCPRPILPFHWLPRLPYLADYSMGGSGTLVLPPTVQTSSRHQNSCACTLRPGVRVNEPGTGRHSTVHSSIRDTLTFKSIFDLLATCYAETRRVRTEFSSPNEPDSRFACLSQQTVSFNKEVTGCLHRRGPKLRYRTFIYLVAWCFRCTLVSYIHSP